jgi:hypothetical protein
VSGRRCAITQAANLALKGLLPMTQRELERELADMTGESVGTIRSRGFSLVEPPDLEPLVVDWDELQQVEPPRIPLTRGPRNQQAA